MGDWGTDALRDAEAFERHEASKPIKALITGATGQVASYLIEHLLSLPRYVVHGTMRRASQLNTQRIDHLYGEPWAEGNRLFLHRADMCDAASLRSVIQKVMPDEVYNLAAQSHVAVSFEQPHYTYESIANGTLALLEAVREICPGAKFYQASSSEMFGDQPAMQNENTPFKPRSPYGCAKAAAFYQAVNHREAYGMPVWNGIIFNCESPRRGETFVTRKITRGIARCHHKLLDHIFLGNIDSKRDWGYAGDYARAIHMMLQITDPGDYVVATGQQHTVRDFIVAVSDWWGRDASEFITPYRNREMRRSDVTDLCGDSSLFRKLTGWEPTKGMREIVAMMMENDMRIAEWESSFKKGK